MSSCCTDIFPVESSSPMEEGLRILARIIARDIMIKRLARAQMENQQTHADNGNDATC